MHKITHLKDCEKSQIQQVFSTVSVRQIISNYRNFKIFLQMIGKKNSFFQNKNKKIQKLVVLC